MASLSETLSIPRPAAGAARPSRNVAIDYLRLLTTFGVVVTHANFLCADWQAASFGGTLGVWLDLLRLGGAPEEGRTGWVATYGRDFGVLGPSELESLIEAAGFTPPAPVFQAAMMRGWAAAKG